MDLVEKVEKSECRNYIKSEWKEDNSDIKNYWNDCFTLEINTWCPHCNKVSNYYEGRGVTIEQVCNKCKYYGVIAKE